MDHESAIENLRAALCVSAASRYVSCRASSQPPHEIAPFAHVRPRSKALCTSSGGCGTMVEFLVTWFLVVFHHLRSPGMGHDLIAAAQSSPDDLSAGRLRTPLPQSGSRLTKAAMAKTVDQIERDSAFSRCRSLPDAIS